jgi:hypothetical protein
MSTIADVAQEVVNRLENRQSSIARAYVWVKDALLELTGDRELRDEFDELEVWGAPYTMPLTTPPTVEFPFSNLLPAVPSGGEVAYNQATLDVMLWVDPPNNTVRIKLNPTHYQDADRVTTPTGSQPAEWYRFGDSIGFNPAPSQAYQVQARILQMHPLAPPLESTTLLLSVEWEAVLTWMAVEVGYIELGEFEKATMVHTLLHGDPKYPTQVGLVGAKHTRRKKENFRQSFGLRPIIRRISYGGR